MSSMLDDKEFKKWTAFQKRHPYATERFFEVHPTGVGSAIIAIAKYERKRIKKDITDYDSW